MQLSLKIIFVLCNHFLKSWPHLFNLSIENIPSFQVVSLHLDRVALELVRNIEHGVIRIGDISVSSMFFIVVVEVVMAICLLSVTQSLLRKSDQTLTQGAKRDLVMILLDVKSLFVLGSSCN